METSFARPSRWSLIDRWIAHNIPTEVLQDTYPRAMRRLAELGFPSGKCVVDTKHGFKMVVDRLDAIKWYIHYFGEFEPQISLAWKRLLKSGDTVVDIGGNVGYHALLAAKCVGPDGHVFTFEPASRNYDDLIENLKINSPISVNPKKIAVSDRGGEVTIRYAGDNEQGSSSIVRGEGIGELVRSIDFSQIESFTPIEKIDLIKIDVEGAEPLVINGMIPVLNRIHNRCVIFIEVGIEHAGNDLLRPFFENKFKAMRISNEYSTRFYRNSNNCIHLEKYEDIDGILQDVILVKDDSVFTKINF